MFGSFRKPGVPCPLAARRAGGKARRTRSWRGAAARALGFSLLALGAGCGENVLVGTWQLRSLTDAGVDSLDDGEPDAAPSPRAVKPYREAHNAVDHARKEHSKGGKGNDGNHH